MNDWFNNPEEISGKAELRQVNVRQIAKAYRIPTYLLGFNPKPRWFRRHVQHWSGYRLWL